MSANANPPAIDGFDAPFSHGCDIPARGGSGNVHIEMPVYRSASGTMPLIMLHELPGMIPQFTDTARKLAADGFRVYAPLIFGVPEDKLRLARFFLQYCVAARMRALFWPDGDRGAGLTPFLLSLIDRVGEENGGAAVGVIGMCMTGGFALAGIAHPRGAAAVSCQPSLPVLRRFTGRSTDILGAEVLGEAVERARQIGDCGRIYRFSTDPLSSKAHVGDFVDAFGAAVTAKEIPAEKAKHASLTADFSQTVYDDAVAFLRERLAMGNDTGAPAS